MTIFDDPKVDCHVHLLNPAAFPYNPAAWYQPGPAEQSNSDYLTALFDTYGVGNAVIVGPNSGYDTDNSCLLDFLNRGAGRFKGLAVVPNDISRAALEDLRGHGVVGTTMQVQLLGVDHFKDAAPLLSHLADLGMFADVQVEDDQLTALAPLLDDAGVAVLIDHCGRPDPTAGLHQSGFELLSTRAATGRYTVKISGMVKASRQRYPYPDAWPFVHALLDAFGPDHCVWGSDWPFLRASERLDYGPLLALVERLVPDPVARRRLLWDNPRRIFSF